MKLLVGRDPRFRQTVLNAIFSLGFAVLIWAAVGARLTDTRRLPVPFELRVPPDVAVEYRDPDVGIGERPLVEVELRGTHEGLSRLNANEIQGVLELTNLDESSLEKGLAQEIEVGLSSFKVPQGCEVVRATPSRLKVVLSRMGKRPFRVKEEITGTPAPGYRRTAVLLDPDEIDVTGPRAVLAKQTGAVKTEPLDITGRHETFTSYRKVHAPDGLVPEDRVRVTVVIEAEPQEREFDFPVRVLTSAETMRPHYVFDPPQKDWHARVLVRGPLDALNNLEARLATYKEFPGEPFAFLRLTGGLEVGQTDAYIELVNLPRELSYTKTKFVFSVKEVTK
jgi:hypothetical protein